MKAKTIPKNNNNIGEKDSAKLFILIASGGDPLIKKAHKLLEQWYEWRYFYDGGFGGGYGSITMTGRMMSGMPGTGCPKCHRTGKLPGEPYGFPGENVTCPICDGAGRIPMEPEAITTKTKPCINCYDKEAKRSMGEVNGKTCLNCRGSGEKVTHHFLANPALIKLPKKSGHKGMTRVYVCEKVDRIIGGLRNNPKLFGLYLVVLEEYTKMGAQREKANRMNISYSTYKRKLSEVRARVALAMWG